MEINEMEARIKELEGKVAILEDLEAIKRLQRTYGYYLEHWMYEEIIDLFADDPETELNILVGIFKGKDGIRRYFSGEKDRGANPEMLHQLMQLSAVVDIDDERKTAAGRWYAMGANALPAGDGILQMWVNGIYTMKYLKEDGVWKIWKLKWNPYIIARPGQGWVDPDRLADVTRDKFGKPPKPDMPRDVDSRYPSGYTPPFHYKHLVTGKETSERKRNRDLNIKGVE